MSETIDREILEKIHDLDKVIAKFEAQFTSEVGLMRSEYQAVSDKMEKVSAVIYGNGNHGLNVRLDRLEQAEKSRKNQHKIMWGGVAAALAPYIQKIIAILTAV